VVVAVIDVFLSVVLVIGLAAIILVEVLTVDVVHRIGNM